jgi:hypothetical protein
MNPPNSAEGSSPKPQPVKYDLGAMLKARPDLYRISVLHEARLEWLQLRLAANVSHSGFHDLHPYLQIDCVNTPDYSIRPSNPALLMGGPLIEYHEEHPLLQKVSRIVPNTDGMDSWAPSVKFAVLIIDQSYIISQRFEIQIEYGKVIGLTPERQQQRLENINTVNDWMKPFQLKTSLPRGRT